MGEFKTPEELYTALDNAIESYTNESISSTQFKKKIDELNDNDFGIIIDKDLVVDNREDFNEEGHVSYEASSYEEDESSYNDDDN